MDLEKLLYGSSTADSGYDSEPLSSFARERLGMPVQDSGRVVGPSFVQEDSGAKQELANEFGIDPTWIDRLVQKESTWDPAARNPVSGARGLIQFLPSTARKMGYQSADEIVERYPTAEAQLRGPVRDYIRRSIQDYGPIRSEQDFYMRVFHPDLREAPPDTILPQKVRDSNPQFRTVGDYVGWVQQAKASPRPSGEVDLEDYLFGAGPEPQARQSGTPPQVSSMDTGLEATATQGAVVDSMAQSPQDVFEGRPEDRVEAEDVSTGITTPFKGFVTGLATMVGDFIQGRVAGTAAVSRAVDTPLGNAIAAQFPPINIMRQAARLAERPEVMEGARKVAEYARTLPPDRWQKEVELATQGDLWNPRKPGQMANTWLTLTAQNAPQYLSSLAGPIGSAEILVHREIGGFDQAANELGIPDDIANQYAVLYGVPSGFSEYVDNLMVLGAGKIPGAKQVTGKIKSEIAKKVLGVLGKKATAALLKTAGLTGVGLVEGIQELGQNALQSYMLGVAAKEAGMNPEQLRAEGKIPPIVDYKSFALGAGIGIISRGGVDLGRVAARNVAQKAVEKKEQILPDQLKEDLKKQEVVPDDTERLEELRRAVQSQESVGPVPTMHQQAKQEPPKYKAVKGDQGRFNELAEKVGVSDPERFDAFLDALGSNEAAVEAATGTLNDKEFDEFSEMVVAGMRPRPLPSNDKTAPSDPKEVGERLADGIDGVVFKGVQTDPEDNPIGYMYDYKLPDGEPATFFIGSDGSKADIQKKVSEIKSRFQKPAELSERKKKKNAAKAKREEQIARAARIKAFEETGRSVTSDEIEFIGVQTDKNGEPSMLEYRVGGENMLAKTPDEAKQFLSRQKSEAKTRELLGGESGHTGILRSNYATGQNLRFTNEYDEMDPAAKRKAIAAERAVLKEYLKSDDINDTDKNRIRDYDRKLRDEAKRYAAEVERPKGEKRLENQFERYVESGEGDTKLTKQIQKDVAAVIDNVDRTDLQKITENRYTDKAISEAVSAIKKGDKDGEAADAIRREVGELLYAGMNPNQAAEWVQGKAAQDFGEEAPERSLADIRSEQGIPEKGSAEAEAEGVFFSRDMPPENPARQLEKLVTSGNIKKAIEAQKKYFDSLNEWAEKQDVPAVFVNQKSGLISVVTPNTTDKRSPWRITNFRVIDGKHTPIGHNEYATKAEAIRDAKENYGDYDTEGRVYFSRDQLDLFDQQPERKPRKKQPQYKTGDLFEGTDAADTRTERQIQQERQAKADAEAIQREMEKREKKAKQGADLTGLDMFSGDVGPINATQQQSLFARNKPRGRLTADVDVALSPGQIGFINDQFEQTVANYLSPDLQKNVRLRISNSIIMGGKAYQFRSNDRAAVSINPKTGIATVTINPKLSPAKIARTLIHEIPGHYGALTVMAQNPAFAKRVKALYQVAPKSTIESLKKRYGNDESVLIKEFVAESMERAESGERGRVRMVWNAVRDFLVKIGFAKDKVDTLMRDMVKEMRKVRTRQGQQGTSYQRQETADTFFSPTLRAAENLKQPKGSGEQMLAMIRKTPGVKQAELDWLGLEDFLKGKKSVTREEIADFVRANQVEIEETKKASGGYSVTTTGQETIDFPTREEAIKRIEEENEWVENESTTEVRITDDRIYAYNFDSEPIKTFVKTEVDGVEGYVEADTYGEPVYPVYSEDELSSEAEAVEAVEHAIEKYKDYYRSLITSPDDLEMGEGDTKYSDYTLPGGTNYRELLLRMPNQPSQSFGEFVEAYRKRYPDTQATVAMIRKYWEAGNTVPRAGSSVAKKDPAIFQSSHWSEPNVFAHARLNDRTGPDGERVLFIEELQSDWEREARDKGVLGRKKREAKLITKPERKSEFNEFFFGTPEETIPEEKVWQILEDGEPVGEVIYTEQGGGGRNGAATEQEALRIWPEAKGVPNQPFLKNWHEVALKRILRMAAEEGYDRVAWINGEQTAERYDLSKQIDAISWWSDNKKRYVTLSGVKGISDQDLEVGVNEDGVITVVDLGAPRGWEGSKLADVIGKDVAEKVFSQPEGKLSGGGLKTQAAWATNLYDRMVPKFLQKYGKKWGAKVEPVDFTPNKDGETKQLKAYNDFVDRMQEKYEFFGSPDELYHKLSIPERRDMQSLQGDVQWAEYSGPTDQLSIPITPEMRESVLFEGQPLFAKDVAEYLKEAGINGWTAEDEVIETGGPKQTQAIVNETAIQLDLFQNQAKNTEMELPYTEDEGKYRKSLIPAAWKMHKRVDLTGHKIKTPADLAHLWKIYRHPRMETFSIVYVDRRNRIVGHNSITAGAANYAYVFELPAKAVRSLWRHELRMKRLNAAGFYLVHNHPSGTMSASSSDRRVTKLYENTSRGFRGHVILDHEKFVFMPPRSKNRSDYDTAVYRLKVPGENWQTQKGEMLMGPEHAMRVAREALSAMGTETAIVTLDIQLAIVGWKPLASDKAINAQTIHQAAREGGGPSTIIITSSQSAFQRAMRAGHDQYKGKPLSLIDVVYVPPKGKPTTARKDANWFPRRVQESKKPSQIGFVHETLFSRTEDTDEALSQVEAIQRELRSLRGKMLGTPKHKLLERAQIEVMIKNYEEARRSEVANAIWNYARTSGIRGHTYSPVDVLIKKSFTAAHFRKAIETIDNALARKEGSQQYQKVLGLVEAGYRRIKAIQGGKMKTTMSPEATRNLQNYLDGLIDTPPEEARRLAQLVNYFQMYGPKDRKTRDPDMRKNLPPDYLDWLDDPNQPVPEGLKTDIKKAFARNLRTMSSQQLKEIANDIQSIIARGRTQKQMQQEAKLAAEDEIGEKVSRQIDAVTRAERKSAALKAVQGRTKWVNMRDMISKGHHALIDPEVIVESFVEWHNDQLIKDQITNPIYRAEAVKLRNVKQMTEAFRKIHSGIDMAKVYNRRKPALTIKTEVEQADGTTKEQDIPLTLANMMAVYAHSQNPGNRAHLHGTGITDEIIDMVEAHLPQEYRDAVDKMIDYFDETMYPRLNEEFRKNTGLDLPKEVRYFPIQNVDTDRAESAVVADFLARNSAHWAATQRGFTKSRVNSSAPFKDLDYFGTVIKHINQVEHYIAYTQTIQDVQRFISRPDVRAAMQTKNEIGYRALRDWLKAVAYGRVSGSDNFLDSASDFMRKKVSLFYLGFKIPTMMKQIASLPRGMGMVDKVAVLKAAYDFSVNPIKALQFANEKSPWMENRMNSYERELAEWREQNAVRIATGAKKVTTKVLDAAVWGMGATDKVVAAILWNGKYAEMVANGSNQQEAIEAADEVIRRTQSRGGVVTMPALYRGGGLARAYTMFTSDLNQSYNLLTRMVGRWGQTTPIEKASELFWFFVTPAVVVAMVDAAFKMPWEEPEEYAREQVSNLVGGIPLLRELIMAGVRAGLDEVKDARNVYVNRYWKRYATDLTPTTFQPFVELGESIAELAPLKILEGLLPFVGVPYDAVKRAYKGGKTAIETKDARYLLWSESRVRGSGTPAENMARKSFSSRRETREEVMTWRKQATKKQLQQYREAQNSLIKEKQQRRIKMEGR